VPFQREHPAEEKTQMTSSLGHHAIVIGGSLAGLMTAAVLADHFDRVTVFERDLIEDCPVLHKSVPQGNHVHALLLGGQNVMSSLYPGFTEELKRLGAVRFRPGVDVVFYGPSGKGYNGTQSVKEPRDLGFEGHIMSRGLLEYHVRRRTAAIANVRLEMDAPIEGLVHDSGRVRGVRRKRAAGTETIEADLVADTGGRSSHASRWLAEMGVQAPENTTIGVDFAYTSTKYRKPDLDHEAEPLLLVGGPPPQHTRAAGLFEIENRTWHVSLAGRFGDYPPTDEAGFLDFAKALPSPRLYELIKNAERIADITHHRFPTSIWRHYERLQDFPAGFLILGDAMCSFNPVYGQGMSSAALQARALQELLCGRAAQARGLDGLASAFFPKAAEAISAPWTLAANFDFAYPQTRGERPQGLAEGAGYFAALDSLQAEDIDVQRLVTEVFQLTKPISALRQEPLLSRILARLQERQRSS
jgi:2-polyprenyl-6-methoxyphenol hydroxylase-like FAD-dependent oxidoreductase